MGGRTIQELKNAMPRSEVETWALFHEMSPLGPERFEYMLAALRFQIWASVPRKNSSLTIEDFMPHWGEEAQRQDFLRKERGFEAMLMSLPQPGYPKGKPLRA